MKRTHREAIEIIGAIMDEAGLSWRTVFGGKHLLFEITGPDKTVYRMPVAGSPRAGIECAMNNQRQQAYRLLERLGLPVTRGRGAASTTGRHHRNRTTSRRLPACDPTLPPTRLSRDPWAALAALREPICQPDDREGNLTP